MKKDTMIIPNLLAIILLSSSILTGIVFAQTEDDAEFMFNQANEHFVNGEYKQAIVIYENILEIAPNNISTLKMKGIVHSNLEEHDKSLKQFFKVLQYRPNDVTSLTGMGIGFGNLGEYQAAMSYFDKALKEKPDSTIIKNYKEFCGKSNFEISIHINRKAKRIRKRISHIHTRLGKTNSKMVVRRKY